jgi:hypothetical protein
MRSRFNDSSAAAACRPVMGDYCRFNTMPEKRYLLRKSS